LTAFAAAWAMVLAAVFFMPPNKSLKRTKTIKITKNKPNTKYSINTTSTQKTIKNTG
jgi:hypothetical protein